MGGRMISKRGIAPLIIILIAFGTLLVGGGTYTGVIYYQSNKLVKQGDELMKEGRFADALTVYEKAGNKFKPIKKKIDAKVAEARKLETGEENIKLGEESFGKGEWQKCLEYLDKVTSEHPGYKTAQERYSDCKKKLDETTAAAATAAATPQAATTSGSTGSSSSKSSSRSGAPTGTSSSGSSGGSGASSSGNQTQARPVLSLPFTVMPPRISPMGETLYHPAPQGHPGIDFIWTNTEGSISIIASLGAMVTAIKASDAHAGAYDVTTQSGNYGVDYTEMGSVKSGLKVGDTVNVGDVVGYAYHPSEFPDSPNYKMFHWQFGYEAEHPEYYQGVATRLCPMTYFTASAKSAIDNLWATTDWAGVDMKGNAPDICSGYYAGKDS